MLISTLIKRYEKFGYTPLNLDQNLEIDNMIRWLFEKYDIYVGLQHITLKFPGSYLKFKTIVTIRSTTEDNYSYYGSKSFKTPSQARFTGVIEAYSSVKSIHEMNKYKNG